MNQEAINKFYEEDSKKKPKKEVKPKLKRKIYTNFSYSSKDKKSE